MIILEKKERTLLPHRGGIRFFLQLPDETFIFIVKEFILRYDKFVRFVSNLGSHDLPFPVKDVIYLRSNGGIASCSFDETIRFWNLETNRCIGIIKCKESIASSTDPFIRNGQKTYPIKLLELESGNIASLHLNTIYIWDAKTIGMCLRRLDNSEYAWKQFMGYNGFEKKMVFYDPCHPLFMSVVNVNKADVLKTTAGEEENTPRSEFEYKIKNGPWSQYGIPVVESCLMLKNGRCLFYLKYGELFSCDYETEEIVAY